jgi:hypothetical protein
VPESTRVGSYVLRYADGETRELPLIYGEDTRDWNYAYEKIADAKYAREAWRDTGDTNLRLLHRAYQNPRPDVEIATLDFISAEADAAPFVVAITVE